MTLADEIAGALRLLTDLARFGRKACGAVIYIASAVPAILALALVTAAERNRSRRLLSAAQWAVYPSRQMQHWANWLWYGEKKDHKVRHAGT